MAKPIAELVAELCVEYLELAYAIGDSAFSRSNYEIVIVGNREAGAAKQSNCAHTATKAFRQANSLAGHKYILPLMISLGVIECGTGTIKP